MQRPTLFLTVGLPGTGKTAAARRIEAEHNALRLTSSALSHCGATAVPQYRNASGGPARVQRKRRNPRAAMRAAMGDQSTTRPRPNRVTKPFCLALVGQMSDFGGDHGVTRPLR